MTIWFTSDTHYGHKNIVRGVSNWRDKSGCRDFESIDEMNDAMVENINAVVNVDDVLYHLGDWSMGHFSNVQEFRERIHCQNIHLVSGNHDPGIRKNREDVQTGFLSVHSLLFEHFEGQGIMMSHFPLLVWEDHHLGVWHLHGHCHGHLTDVAYLQRKVMDVGLDTHPEFRPYSFDEIRAIMDERQIVKIDHH